MSSDVVNIWATCSKTVKGKQYYAICVSCSSRVHCKCYRDGLNNSRWTMIRPTFTCTACEAGIPNGGRGLRSEPSHTSFDGSQNNHIKLVINKRKLFDLSPGEQSNNTYCGCFKLII